MIPDAKWLDAFKLPLKINIAISLASILLLGLEMADVLILGPITQYARPVLILLSVVFSVLALVGLADFFLAPRRKERRQSALAARRSVRRQEAEERLQAEHRRALGRLDHLSKEEIHYVANCLRNQTPTFYTWVHSPPVTVLMGKGLVWTPGGQHHQDHYPFSFVDFAWEELLRRKDEFIAKDDEFKRAEEAAGRARLKRRY